MIDMQAISLHTLATALALAAAATLAGQVKAGGELVKFPEKYAEGVHYATVDRGNRRQEMFTSRAAIDAVKNGQPIPSGTVITLVDYLAKLDGRGNPLRDASCGLIKGEISRYVVMEKRTGWGAEYPPELRNGKWEFQAFNADRSVNQNENLNRCFSCHKLRERQDFVFTFDQMKSVKSVGVWLETIIDHVGGGAEPGRRPGQNRRDREPAEAVRCRKRRPHDDPAGWRSSTAGSARL
jgi:Cytochrome P460